MQHGLVDTLQAFRRWRMWVYLGSLEIKQRYRRTLLGPFWITIALALFVGACSVIYGVLFKQDVAAYMPYVAAGYISWAFISGYIGEAASVFIQNEGFIKQIKLPVMIYPLKMLWRMILTFFHHMIVLLLVLLAFSEISISGLFMAALGLLVNCIAVLGAGTILALYSVRNRDIPVLVNSIFQILFLITPIIWPASALGTRMEIAQFNPFFHMIEAIRSPILGGSLEVWLGHITVILICSVPLLMVSLWLLSRQKDELNFYL